MTQNEIIRMAREAEIPCKDHPEAPHGFCRDASISYDRYVCECEFWEPEENKIYTQAELDAAVLAEREACIEKCKPYGLTGECVAIAIRARGE